VQIADVTDVEIKLRLDAESVLEPGDDADQLGPFMPSEELDALGPPSPLALIERSNAPAQTEWPKASVEGALATPEIKPSLTSAAIESLQRRTRYPSTVKPIARNLGFVSLGWR
jgi:hypothetical protein